MRLNASSGLSRDDALKVVTSLVAEEGSLAERISWTITRLSLVYTTQRAMPRDANSKNPCAPSTSTSTTGHTWGLGGATPAEVYFKLRRAHRKAIAAEGAAVRSRHRRPLPDRVPGRGPTLAHSRPEVQGRVGCARTSWLPAGPAPRCVRQQPRRLMGSPSSGNRWRISSSAADDCVECLTHAAAEDLQFPLHPHPLRGQSSP
jgi:hypothetical protein